MKKSIKRAIAERLVEKIRKGEAAVDHEGNLIIKGIIRKRRISGYILRRMEKLGARLNRESQRYEVS
ncbi:MAG: hypothetical protein JXA07_04055 [Spirochaetes bacterium]|nr:hypothetical protein [Spirochaetota bacterium]